MTIKERVMRFINSAHISTRQFELNCGLSNGAVSKMGNSTRRSVIDKILSAYPEINESWLLTGNGEMLKCSNILIEDDKNIESSKLGPNSRMIPFYDAETTGGYSGLVSSSTNDAQLMGYIQPGGWFDGRETAAIRHVGNSMTEYPDGCVLAVREVTERRLLVPGRNYVVETSEYRVTKRIQRGSEPGFIALYSTNQEKYDDGRLVYEPFEVALEDIRRIFSVLGYIVNQSGEYRLIKP